MSGLDCAKVTNEEIVDVPSRESDPPTVIRWEIVIGPDGGEIVKPCEVMAWTTMRQVRFKGIVWKRGDPDTDFSAMYHKYPYALFVFCGNAEQDGMSVTGYGSPGGGSACIRGRLRALGIPTGQCRVGFRALTPGVKAIIDNAIDNIATALDQGGYTTVFFPMDPRTRSLGHGIFQVDRAVSDYIIERLKEMEYRWFEY
jgi:hypothetical protein